MHDMDLLIDLAKQYGLTVETVPKGQGGMFYQTKDGTKKEITIEDLDFGGIDTSLQTNRGTEVSFE